MSNTKLSWIVTPNNISVNYDGQSHIVPRNGELAERLIKALKDKNYDAIPMLVSNSKKIETYSKGKFVVQNGQIMLNGVAAPVALSKKILAFLDEGLPYEPLIKFAENLQRNPSFRAVNELFQFLEKNDHPITEDGCFIAYKKVRDDFKDVHTGTFDNSPGTTVTMSRNQVNEDSAQTCSSGLHVANWGYASQFYAGGVMLEVVVNPADVVSVPADYNQSKMRVCKYMVLGVVDQEHSSDLSLRVINDSSSEQDYHEEPEEDEEVEETYCEDCGEVVEDDCSALCITCEDKETKDEYPWEDEV